MTTNTHPSAATRVFGIVELLANILSFLEPLDLFPIQRVNSTFRNTMSESKQVREAMLIEPTNHINVEAINTLLHSPAIKQAIHPFETQVFWKPWNTPYHRLRVRYEWSLRQCSVLSRQERLEQLINEKIPSWRQIQMGASNRGLQLSLKGFLTYPDPRQIMLPYGADLGDVIETLCKTQLEGMGVTQHRSWRQYGRSWFNQCCVL